MMESLAEILEMAEKDPGFKKAISAYQKAGKAADAKRELLRSTEAGLAKERNRLEKLSVTLERKEKRLASQTLALKKEKDSFTEWSSRQRGEIARMSALVQTEKESAQETFKKGNALFEKGTDLMKEGQRLKAENEAKRRSAEQYQRALT